jgi:hypothetical protein
MARPTRKRVGVHGFSTVLAASSPLLANASAGRRGGMGMEPAYPEVPATHLCDNHGIRPVQVGKAREWVGCVSRV